MFRLLAALLLMVGGFLVLSSPAHADPPNGGFEGGDLSNWTTTIPAEGTITVVDVCNFGADPEVAGDNGDCPGDFAPYSAVEGGLFARLKADGPGSFTSLQRSFNVVPGTVISGYAFFADAEAVNDSLGFCDGAEVIVQWHGSATGSATLFSANSCDVIGSPADPMPDSTDWTSFQYLAQSGGLLILEARVSNGGDDDAFDSVMGLDGVSVVGPAVSLPQAISVGPQVGGGAAGIIGAITEGVSASEQTVPPAAPIAPPSTGTGVITPPSTGDAGLLPAGRPGLLPAVVVAMALIALGAAVATRRARL